MAGLAKICKMFGGMKVQGESFVWDYVANKAVPEKEMPQGSDRWKASEKAKWTAQPAREGPTSP
jgi:hypothetical protein